MLNIFELDASHFNILFLNVSLKSELISVSRNSSSHFTYTFHTCHTKYRKSKTSDLFQANSKVIGI
ncbi:MAG: hypothetical protein LBQ59_04840 [Candidatus Peribacteria bacterium]|nr:hypothetical protein [Candidatus Peribacteria bacterium]